MALYLSLPCFLVQNLVREYCMEYLDMSTTISGQDGKKLTWVQDKITSKVSRWSGDVSVNETAMCDVV